VKRKRILVIEDEPDIRELIAYNLSREGYQVSEAEDGESGLDKARRELPDLVLLDLMLPRLSGVEVCRRLKSEAQTQGLPVIMVTAKGDEDDVVSGFDTGADDYIPKPFSPKVLLARVKAVLRRASEDEESGRIVRDGLVIDPERHEVVVDGERVQLTATEFRLLHFLATNPGRVFTREHLLSRVIGENAVVTDRNIDVHVGSVRKKLGNYRALIETVRGVGYRFLDG